MDHRNDMRNDLRNDVRNDLRNDLRNDFRNDLRNDMRSRLEDGTIPPAAKRQAQQEDAHDPRLPPPTTPTTGQPGANIKITSRGKLLLAVSCRGFHGEKRLVIILLNF